MNGPWREPAHGVPGISWLELLILFEFRSKETFLPDKRDGKQLLGARPSLQATLASFRAACLVVLARNFPEYRALFVSPKRGTQPRYSPLGIRRSVATLRILPVLADSELLHLHAALLCTRGVHGAEAMMKFRTGELMANWADLRLDGVPRWRALPTAVVRPPAPAFAPEALLRRFECPGRCGTLLLTGQRDLVGLRLRCRACAKQYRASSALCFVCKLPGRSCGCADRSKFGDLRQLLFRG